MSNSLNFTTEIILENKFYSDAYKAFSIATTRTHWTTPFGRQSSEGIQILRYRFDPQSKNFKVTGRVQFPTKVWEYFSANLGTLLLTICPPVDLKIESSIAANFQGL